MKIKYTEIVHKISENHITDHPVVGMTVGGTTAAYGLLADIASVAEQVGIIAGAFLTVCLSLDFIIKKIQKYRKNKH